jgi:hypothetical protein
VLIVNAIKTWISHNQGMFLALMIVAGLLVWTYGCDSKVSSLISEGQKVTRAELNLEVQQETGRLEAELDLLIKQAALKFQKLDRQDEIKQKLFNFAAVSAESGTVNPIGVITLLGAFLGAGAVVDNRIKDKVIANRPLQSKTADSASS